MLVYGELELSKKKFHCLLHPLEINFWILHSRIGSKLSKNSFFGTEKSQNKPFLSRSSTEIQQIEMQIRDIDKDDNDYYSQLKTQIQQEQFSMAESRYGDVQVEDIEKSETKK